MVLAILARIRKMVGKNLYPIYLPMGICYGKFQIFMGSFCSHAKWVEHKDISDKKGSDTLFVLGSGGSIDEYNEKQWDEIRKCDSLGFNFWLLHDLVPTYYMFELPRDKDNQNAFLHNLGCISEKYTNTLMFLKEGTKGMKGFNLVPDGLRDRVKVLFNPTLPIQSKTQISKAMLKMKKEIHKSKKRLVIFNKRASLFTAVGFAYACGYKKIVLCGIDLNSTKYFYENNQKRILSRGMKIPVSGQNGVIHKTDSIEFGEVTISELLKGLHREVLKPNSIELYTGSKNSALYEWLPYYWEVKK